jgi:heme/copper-type cytochrome/quinol oxidase subunit 2
MPAFSQNYGGPLTESEIDDISAFIVSLGSTAPQPVPTATPAPTADSGTNWLMIILVLIGVVAVILLIVAFSGRGEAT